jgi:MFS family permease
MYAQASPDRTNSALLWLLTLVTFSGALDMHIFVPALPFTATDLGAGISEMQLTTSLYILGLAARGATTGYTNQGDNRCSIPKTRLPHSRSRT